MAEDSLDPRDGSATGARKLIARAAAAEARALRGLAVAVEDFFLPEEFRLDERTRTELSSLLQALVETVEAEIREHGARLLAARGETRLAASLLEPGVSAFDRLSRGGLLRDGELIAELIARVQQEALSATLPTHVSDDPERPSLVNRFVQHPDRVLATAAMGVLIAESRRRGSPDLGRLTHTDLPAELHHRLVWWVSAALRERFVGADDRLMPLLDQALCDAAQRSLAAYDEGDRLESTAMRFAAAIDAQASELPALLAESLGDRRIVLFVALLAHALGLEYTVARELVLEPSADRLWLALRALELPREAIAQIGYALCEADPRRELETFAEMLDEILAIGGEDARDALLPVRLHPDYRAARLALNRGATVR